MAETARLLGFSAQNLRQVYLPFLAPEDKRDGRPAVVRVAAVVELIVSRQVADRTRAATPPTDDPLLAEGDSPGLERYRLAKAKLAELDLELRRGTLIEVGKCRDVLARWGSLLRRCGERLAKLNPEAARIQSETLDECESLLREFDP